MNLTHTYLLTILIVLSFGIEQKKKFKYDFHFWLFILSVACQIWCIFYCNFILYNRLITYFTLVKKCLLNKDHFNTVKINCELTLLNYTIVYGVLNTSFLSIFSCFMKD